MARAAFAIFIGLVILAAGCIAIPQAQGQSGTNASASPVQNASPAPNQTNASPAAPYYPPMNGGDYPQRMAYGGYERYFIVHVPSGYDPAKAYPLVFVFHGHGGSAQDIEQTTGFSGKADEEGFVAVYPQGLEVDGNASTSSWNAGACCGFAMQQSYDDIGFVGAMMDSIEGRLDIDKGRVYATGFSNGGMLTYALGCRLADRLAAIAPVSGAIEESDCSPARPLPLIAFHGTADPAVPYYGGEGIKGVTGDKPFFRPVPDEIAFWAAQNGCSGTAERNITVALSLQNRTGCAAPVELYTIKDGVHAWPGGGDLPARSPDYGVPATDMIWDFFRAHARD